MNSPSTSYSQPDRVRSGFTLIEVVLALGVFLVSILALIGLLSPMLQSVSQIEKIDEITSVVSSVNAFLQSSPDIAAPGKTRFESIYDAVSPPGGNQATIFVYRYYDDTGTDERIRLEVGFSPDESEFVGANSIVNDPASNPANFNSAAGPIYRVVLTPSPVIPEEFRTNERVPPTTGTYRLETPFAAYVEGSLALEVRIFAESPPGPSPAVFDTQTDLDTLSRKKPDFTFNTAITR